MRTLRFDVQTKLCLDMYQQAPNKVKMNQDWMDRDMDLRAPLPPEHRPPPASDDGDSTLVRGLLCRMYVGARAMRLGTEARFSALVLFHRYVAACAHASTDVKETMQMQKDNGDDPSKGSMELRHLGFVAAACLFLSAKTEEEPRRIRDVINLLHVLDFRGDAKVGDGGVRATSPPPFAFAFESRFPMESSGATTVPTTHIYEVSDPPDLDEKYWEMKEKIVAFESIVLRMIRFDASVSHPHRAVLVIMETLDFDSIVERKDDLVAGAWRILNDALFSTAALCQPVLPLACGALCVSAEHMESSWADNSQSASDQSKRYRGMNMPRRHKEGFLPQKWWRAIGVDDKATESAKDSLKKATMSL